MARKDPTDLTVEEKLKALYQLQLTLSQIDEKRALRGELPLEVEDLENEVEGLNVRLDKIQYDINDYEQAIMQRRADIEEARASVERYNRQLDEVKNNREYDTLTKEIEFQELEIQLCEKKIKEAVQKVEERKRDMMRAEEQLNDRETALEDKRGELDEIMQETREEEEILKAKAKDYETRIESRLLQSFKRQRDACGGCFNKIPPQRQLDIKMHKKIIVCEYCGRILVDPELAGVKIEKPTEKKTKKRSIRRIKKDEEA